MRKRPEKIDTCDECSYGCGERAQFINGSGRLMCRSSSNSCPANRKKNSSGLSKAHQENRHPGFPPGTRTNRAWAKGLTKETDERVAKWAATIKQKYECGEIVPHRTPHTEETKRILSSKRSEWLKNPENRKNYGRGKRSWMEQSFEEWLSSNGIIGWDSETHFWNPILKKNYFVDFINEEKKLIIELDGTQHRKTKDVDDARDEYFRSIGYDVRRITHEEFKKRLFGEGFKDILGC